VLCPNRAQAYLSFETFSNDIHLVTSTILVMWVSRITFNLQLINFLKLYLHEGCELSILNSGSVNCQLVILLRVLSPPPPPTVTWYHFGTDSEVEQFHSLWRFLLRIWSRRRGVSLQETTWPWVRRSLKCVVLIIRTLRLCARSWRPCPNWEQFTYASIPCIS
jgi:hypothetical protein